MTFDALEKVIILAVAKGDLEIAAEYTDSLFLLADQLDEFHVEFRNESQRLSYRDAEIERQDDSIHEAVNAVVRWGLDHDHSVADWFRG